MEQFDLYNYDRSLSGKIMNRGTKVPEGLYRLVVYVCIFNSRGEMLIQQRQTYKKSWSNLWDLTLGGHVQAGETSWQGANRELLEELGLHHDFTGTPPAITLTFTTGYDDYYLLQQDLEISQLHFQKEEVQGAKWASLDQILKMIDDSTFIPYHKGFIQFLFAMKDKLTVHTREDWTKPEVQ